MLNKVYTVHIDYLKDPKDPSSYYYSMQESDIAFTSLKKALSYLDMLKKALAEDGKQVLISETDRAFILTSDRQLHRRFYIRELKTV